MKIIHLTTSNKGGAGIAALRLHEGLLKNGVDSKFLSLYQFPSEVKEQYKFREQDFSKFPFFLRIQEFCLKVLKHLNLYNPISIRFSEKYLKNRPLGFDHFSFPFSSNRIENHPLLKQADIIHLHWVSDGFVNYESFLKNCSKKIVWTLHDMNPFTGGCHYSDGCIKYETSCAICPQLKNTIDENFSKKILKIKFESFFNISDSQVLITAPSQWLTNLSQKSLLFKRFKHYNIHNCMDQDVFKVIDKREARKKLKLPFDKYIVLFVSYSVSNIRKGLDFLLEALNEFSGNDNIVLCSVGSNSVEFKSSVPHYKMGYISDENTMALIYAAADVFVSPSMADNFPNTICESLMCGTPIVAFNVGGVSELINDFNGKIVEPFDVNKLYEAIDFVVKNKSKFDSNKISEEATKKFNKNTITKQFLELYTECKEL